MKIGKMKCRRGIAWVLTLIMAFSLISGSIFSQTKTVSAAESEFTDGLTATSVEEGVSYYYDFTGMSDIENTYTKGLFSFSAGSYHGAGYSTSNNPNQDNGTYYGVEFKSGNKLTFPVAGDSYIVVGGDNNNTCTDLTASSTTGTFATASQSTVTSGHATLDNCKERGTNTIVYDYTGEKGNVTLTLDPSYTKAAGQTSTKAYIAYVCVIPKEYIEAGTYTFGEYANTDSVKAIKGLSLTNLAWHDTQHGLQTSTGASMTLSLSGNANITIIQCSANGTASTIDSTSGTVSEKVTLEGGTDAGVQYDITGATGETKISFTGSNTASAYIHSIKVEYVEASEDNEDEKEENGGAAAEAKETRTVAYDFTANTNKTKPEVGSILEGTNTTTSGILYADAGSSSGCTFDANQLRFRLGVELDLPIQDDTTKIKLAITFSQTNADRPTYIGSTDSGYTMEMDTAVAPVTLDDITDYIVEKNGQKYLPIISGGDIKIKTITLTEYNPINTVTVNGTIEGAAAAGITEISFKNLDNENAAAVKATVSSDNTYEVTLRRVAGNTNYVASVSKVGYKIDTTDDANKFTLTGNGATATVDFKIVEASVVSLSGTISGIPADAVKGELAVKFVPENTALEAVTAELKSSTDNNYTYTASLEAGLKYSVELVNADDYEVKDTVQNEKGTVTLNLTATAKDTVTVSGSFVTSDKNDAGVTKITFTNMDTPSYTYTFDVTGTQYTAKLRKGEYQTSVVAKDGYTAFDKVSVGDTDVENDVYLQTAADTSAVDYKSEITVGKGQEFETLREAVAYITRMTRGDNDRVTITLTDKLYREQLVIDTPNITIKGNGATITWYYGFGFSYYSAKLSADKKSAYYDEAYAVDKYDKQAISQNPGHWGATVNLLSGAKGFQAEDLTFENSLNRYLTDEELADGAAENASASITDRTTANIDVSSKAAKERACVIYIQADDTEYKNCKFLSCQDTIYTGDANENSYFVDCVIEGYVDYICGDGNPVFDKCTLSMYGYSDQNATGGFIVASKAKGTHGYLFNECKVVSTDYAGIKTTSGNYFARAWDAGTVVFYNTEIESADMISAAAYADMNAKVTAAHYYEYKTHTPDGTAVSTTGRAQGVTIWTDEDAEKLVLTDYFDGWDPEYYEGEVVEEEPSEEVTTEAPSEEESTEAPSEEVTTEAPSEEATTEASSGLDVKGDDTVSSVVTDGDVVFKDKAGNPVVGDVILHTEKLQAAPTEEIAEKVESLIKGVIDVQVMYFDITAYAVSVDDANVVTLSNGNVKIKFTYPEGVGKANEIIALHNTDSVPVDKESDGFWITADGFSPYTVIIKPAVAQNDDDDDDDTTDTTETIAPTEAATQAPTEAVTEPSAEAAPAETVTPETGDSTPFVLFIVVAFASALGLAASFKKRYNN